MEGIPECSQRFWKQRQWLAEGNEHEPEALIVNYQPMDFTGWTSIYCPSLIVLKKKMMSHHLALLQSMCSMNFGNATE